MRKLPAVDVLYYHGCLDDMKAEVEAINRTIPELEQRKRQLEDRIEAGSGINEIIDGLPIYSHDRGVMSRCAEITRYAGIHENACYPGFWAVTVYDQPNQSTYAKDTFCGAGWPTRESALQACRDWVLDATMPQKHPSPRS